MPTRRTRPKRSDPTAASPRIAKSLVLVLLPCSVANAQEQPEELTEPQRKAFAVMDEVAGHDTSKLPFVRVSWQPPQRTARAYRYGFVVRREGGFVRIRHLDGSHSTIATGDDTATSGRITKQDLREVMDRMIGMAARKRDDYPAVLLLRLLYLTRAAALRGHVDLVHRAWAVLPDHLVDAYELKKDGTEHALVHSSERRLTLDFADPEISFAQLERDHERWLERLPEVVRGFGGGKKGAARRAAAQHTNRLRQRVSARLERIRQTRRSLDAPLPSAHSEAQRLVQSLPEARHRSNGYRLRYKYARNHHDAQATESLEDRLVALGLAAVPHLVASLPSTALTRCHNGKDQPLCQRTVGEVAEDLLVEIAGYAPKGEDRSAVWQAWLEAVQARGLRKVMEDELRTGDGTVITAYLKRWPEQWARVITIIDKPEQNISGTIALLNGLPEKLPRQALVACERVFASSIQDVFKAMVAKELAQRLAPNGGNALGETLKADTIPAGTKRRLQRLVPGK